MSLKNFDYRWNAISGMALKAQEITGGSAAVDGELLTAPWVEMDQLVLEINATASQNNPVVTVKVEQVDSTGAAADKFLDDKNGTDLSATLPTITSDGAASYATIDMSRFESETYDQIRVVVENTAAATNDVIISANYLAAKKRLGFSNLGDAKTATPAAVTRANADLFWALMED